jgi:hypothetical protein
LATLDTFTIALQFVSKLCLPNTQNYNRTTNLYQNTLFSKHTKLVTDHLWLCDVHAQ